LLYHHAHRYRDGEELITKLEILFSEWKEDGLNRKYYVNSMTKTIVKERIKRNEDVLNTNRARAINMNYPKLNFQKDDSDEFSDGYRTPEKQIKKRNYDNEASPPSLRVTKTRTVQNSITMTSPASMNSEQYLEYLLVTDPIFKKHYYENLEPPSPELNLPRTPPRPIAVRECPGAPKKQPFRPLFVREVD
jgi:hypothetical protein